MSVTWINCFEMPDGRQDSFFEVWHKQFAAHFAAKPGFVSYRMYRARSPQGRFQFVNVTQWESPAHIEAAHDATFRELLKHPALAEVVAIPAMFDVVAQSA